MFALTQGRARLAGTGTTLAANSGTAKLRATGGQLAVDAYQAVNAVSRGYGELLAPLDVRLGAVQGSAAASGTLVHAYSQAGTTSLRAGLHSTSQAKGSDSTHIAADSSSALGTSSVYLIAGRAAQIAPSSAFVTSSPGDVTCSSSGAGAFSAGASMSLSGHLQAVADGEELAIRAVAPTSRVIIAGEHVAAVGTPADRSVGLFAMSGMGVAANSGSVLAHAQKGVLASSLSGTFSVESDAISTSAGRVDLLSENIQVHAGAPGLCASASQDILAQSAASSVHVEAAGANLVSSTTASLSAGGDAVFLSDKFAIQGETGILAAAQDGSVSAVASSAVSAQASSLGIASNVDSLAIGAASDIRGISTAMLSIVGSGGVGVDSATGSLAIETRSAAGGSLHASSAFGSMHITGSAATVSTNAGSVAWNAQSVSIGSSGSACGTDLVTAGALDAEGLRVSASTSSTVVNAATSVRCRAFTGDVDATALANGIAVSARATSKLLSSLGGISIASSGHIQAVGDAAAYLDGHGLLEFASTAADLAMLSGHGATYFGSLVDVASAAGAHVFGFGQVDVTASSVGLTGGGAVGLTGTNSVDGTAQALQVSSTETSLRSTASHVALTSAHKLNLQSNGQGVVRSSAAAVGFVARDHSVAVSASNTARIDAADVVGMSASHTTIRSHGDVLVHSSGTSQVLAPAVQLLAQTGGISLQSATAARLASGKNVRLFGAEFSTQVNGRVTVASSSTLGVSAQSGVASATSPSGLQVAAAHSVAATAPGGLLAFGATSVAASATSQGSDLLATAEGNVVSSSTGLVISAGNSFGLDAGTLSLSATDQPTALSSSGGVVAFSSKRAAQLRAQSAGLQLHSARDMNLRSAFGLGMASATHTTLYTAQAASWSSAAETRVAGAGGAAFSSSDHLIATSSGDLHLAAQSGLLHAAGQDSVTFGAGGGDLGVGSAAAASVVSAASASIKSLSGALGLQGRALHIAASDVALLAHDETQVKSAAGHAALSAPSAGSDVKLQGYGGLDASSDKGAVLSATGAVISNAKESYVLLAGGSLAAGSSAGDIDVLSKATASVAREHLIRSGMTRISSSGDVEMWASRVASSAPIQRVASGSKLSLSAGGATRHVSARGRASAVSSGCLAGSACPAGLAVSVLSAGDVALDSSRQLSWTATAGGALVTSQNSLASFSAGAAAVQAHGGLGASGGTTLLRGRTIAVNGLGGGQMQSARSTHVRSARNMEVATLGAQIDVASAGRVSLAGERSVQIGAAGGIAVTSVGGDIRFGVAHTQLTTANSAEWHVDSIGAAGVRGHTGVNVAALESDISFEAAGGSLGLNSVTGGVFIAGSFVGLAAAGANDVAVYAAKDLLLRASSSFGMSAALTSVDSSRNVRLASSSIAPVRIGAAGISFGSAQSAVDVAASADLTLTAASAISTTGTENVHVLSGDAITSTAPGTASLVAAGATALDGSGGALLEAGGAVHANSVSGRALIRAQRDVKIQSDDASFAAPAGRTVQFSSASRAAVTTIADVAIDSLNGPVAAQAENGLQVWSLGAATVGSVTGDALVEATGTVFAGAMAGPVLLTSGAGLAVEANGPFSLSAASASLGYSQAAAISAAAASRVVLSSPSAFGASASASVEMRAARDAQTAGSTARVQAPGLSIAATAVVGVRASRAVALASAADVGIISSGADVLLAGTAADLTGRDGSQVSAAELLFSSAAQLSVGAIAGPATIRSATVSVTGTDTDVALETTGAGTQVALRGATLAVGSDSGGISVGATTGVDTHAAAMSVAGTDALVRSAGPVSVSSAQHSSMHGTDGLHVQSDDSASAASGSALTLETQTALDVAAGAVTLQSVRVDVQASLTTAFQALRDMFWTATGSMFLSANGEKMASSSRALSLQGGGGIDISCDASETIRAAGRVELTAEATTLTAKNDAVFNAAAQSSAVISAAGNVALGNNNVAASAGRIAVFAEGGDVTIRASSSAVLSECASSQTSDPCVQLLLAGWSCAQIAPVHNCEIARRCHFCDGSVGRVAVEGGVAMEMLSHGGDASVTSGGLLALASEAASAALSSPGLLSATSDGPASVRSSTYSGINAMQHVAVASVGETSVGSAGVMRLSTSTAKAAATAVSGARIHATQAAAGVILYGAANTAQTETHDARSAVDLEGRNGVTLASSTSHLLGLARNALSAASAAGGVHVSGQTGASILAPQSDTTAAAVAGAATLTSRAGVEAVSGAAAVSVLTSSRMGIRGQGLVHMESAGGLAVAGSSTVSSSGRHGLAVQTAGPAAVSGQSLVGVQAQQRTAWRAAGNRGQLVLRGADSIGADSTSSTQLQSAQDARIESQASDLAIRGQAGAQLRGQSGNFALSVGGGYTLEARALKGVTLSAIGGDIDYTGSTSVLAQSTGVVSIGGKRVSVGAGSSASVVLRSTSAGTALRAANGQTSVSASNAIELATAGGDIAVASTGNTAFQTTAAGARVFVRADDGAVAVAGREVALGSRQSHLHAADALHLMSDSGAAFAGESVHAQSSGTLSMQARRVLASTPRNARMDANGAGVQLAATSIWGRSNTGNAIVEASNVGVAGSTLVLSAGNAMNVEAVSGLLSLNALGGGTLVGSSARMGFVSNSAELEVASLDSLIAGASLQTTLGGTGGVVLESASDVTAKATGDVALIGEAVRCVSQSISTSAGGRLRFITGGDSSVQGRAGTMLSSDAAISLASQGTAAPVSVLSTNDLTLSSTAGYVSLAADQGHVHVGAQASAQVGTDGAVSVASTLDVTVQGADQSNLIATGTAGLTGHLHAEVAASRGAVGVQAFRNGATVALRGQTGGSITSRNGHVGLLSATSSTLRCTGPVLASATDLRASSAGSIAVATFADSTLARLTGDSVGLLSTGGSVELYTAQNFRSLAASAEVGAHGNADAVSHTSVIRAASTSLASYGGLSLGGSGISMSAVNGGLLLESRISSSMLHGSAGVSVGSTNGVTALAGQGGVRGAAAHLLTVTGRSADVRGAAVVDVASATSGGVRSNHARLYGSAKVAMLTAAGHTRVGANGLDTRSRSVSGTASDVATSGDTVAIASTAGQVLVRGTVAVATAQAVTINSAAYTQMSSSTGASVRSVAGDANLLAHDGGVLVQAADRAEAFATAGLLVGSAGGPVLIDAAAHARLESTSSLDLASGGDAAIQSINGALLQSSSGSVAVSGTAASAHAAAVSMASASADLTALAQNVHSSAHRSSFLGTAVAVATVGQTLVQSLTSDVTVSASSLVAQGNSVTVGATLTSVSVSSVGAGTILSRDGHLTASGQHNLVRGSGAILSSADRVQISSGDEIRATAHDLAVASSSSGVTIVSNAGSVLAASTSAVSAGAHDVHLVALGDDVGMQASGALRLVGERVSAAGDNTALLCHNHDLATESIGIDMASGDCSGAELVAGNNVRFSAQSGAVGFVAAGVGEASGAAVALAAERGVGVVAARAIGLTSAAPLDLRATDAQVSSSQAEVSVIAANQMQLASSSLSYVQGNAGILLSATAADTSATATDSLRLIGAAGVDAAAHGKARWTAGSSVAQTAERLVGVTAARWVSLRGLTGDVLIGSSASETVRADHLSVFSGGLLSVGAGRDTVASAGHTASVLGHSSIAVLSNRGALVMSSHRDLLRAEGAAALLTSVGGRVALGAETTLSLRSSSVTALTGLSGVSLQATGGLSFNAYDTVRLSGRAGTSIGSDSGLKATTAAQLSVHANFAQGEVSSSLAQVLSSSDANIAGRHSASLRSSGSAWLSSRDILSVHSAAVHLGSSAGGAILNGNSGLTISSGQEATISGRGSVAVLSSSTVSLQSGTGVSAYAEDSVQLQSAGAVSTQAASASMASSQHDASVLAPTITIGASTDVAQISAADEVQVAAASTNSDVLVTAQQSVVAGAAGAAVVVGGAGVDIRSPSSITHSADGLIDSKGSAVTWISHSDIAAEAASRLLLTSSSAVAAAARNVALASDGDTILRASNALQVASQSQLAFSSQADADIESVAGTLRLAAATSAAVTADQVMTISGGQQSTISATHALQLVSAGPVSLQGSAGVSVASTAAAVVLAAGRVSQVGGLVTLEGLASVGVESTAVVSLAAHQGNVRSASRSMDLAAPTSASVAAAGTVLLRSGASSPGAVTTTSEAVALESAGTLGLAAAQNVVASSTGDVVVLSGQLLVRSCEHTDVDLSQHGAYSCTEALAHLRDVGATCYTDLVAFGSFGVNGILASFCPHACGVCDIHVSGASASVGASSVSADAPAGRISISSSAQVNLAASASSARAHLSAGRVRVSPGAVGVSVAAAGHIGVAGTAQALAAGGNFVAQSVAGSLNLNAPQLQARISANAAVLESGGRVSVDAPQAIGLTGPSFAVSANAVLQPAATLDLHATRARVNGRSHVVVESSAATATAASELSVSGTQLLGSAHGSFILSNAGAVLQSAHELGAASSTSAARLRALGAVLVGSAAGDVFASAAGQVVLTGSGLVDLVGQSDIALLSTSGITVMESSIGPSRASADLKLLSASHLADATYACGGEVNAASQTEAAATGSVGAAAVSSSDALEVVTPGHARILAPEVVCASSVGGVAVQGAALRASSAELSTLRGASGVRIASPVSVSLGGSGVGEAITVDGATSTVVSMQQVSMAADGSTVISSGTSFQLGASSGVTAAAVAGPASLSSRASVLAAEACAVVQVGSDHAAVALGGDDISVLSDADSTVTSAALTIGTNQDIALAAGAALSGTSNSLALSGASVAVGSGTGDVTISATSAAVTVNGGGITTASQQYFVTALQGTRPTHAVCIVGAFD